MIEVEVRSLLYESMQPKVQEKLAPMRQVKAGASFDIYYDTADYALLCHSQMVFLRLREGCLLQIKYNAARAKNTPPPCMEREYVLEAGIVPDEANALLRRFLPGWQSATTWQELLRCNQLEELAHIDKHRSVYTDDLFLVCVDTVANLGQCIEVEINCPEDSDIRAAQTQVDAFLAEIGGTPLKAGYVEMFLYVYKPQTYQLIPARFQVEGDVLPVRA